jgi:TM2 domain-containing membrane protein YozV
MTTKFCLICTFLCGICLIGKAQTTSTGLSAADSLFASGQFLAARVGYERVLFVANEEPVTKFSAVIGKARCLKQQGLYGAAATFLNGQIQTNYPDSLQYWLRHEQILCTYLAGQFENTLSQIERLPYLHPSTLPSPLLMAVRVMTLNELRRWPEADTAYHTLAKYVRADTTRPNPYQQLPRLKSEKKAQWLSTFIPGAGQLYAGKPGEAALSILVQSAGLYFGITSFLQGYYLSAWGAGAGLFGSFHAGGVRRAEVLVQQLNQKRATVFNRQARQQVLELVK